MMHTLGGAIRATLVVVVLGLSAATPVSATHEAVLTHPALTEAHPSPASAGMRRAHATGGHQEHRHDSEECTCRGACAATAPRAVPSDAGAFVLPSVIEGSHAAYRDSAAPPRGLKAYLYPLPNAPPSRA